MRPNDWRILPNTLRVFGSLSWVPCNPLIFQGEREVMTRRAAYMLDFSRFGAPIYNLVKFAWGVINVAVTSRLVTELPFVGTGGGGGR